jgi:hypothetical protein
MSKKQRLFVPFGNNQPYKFCRNDCAEFSDMWNSISTKNGDGGVWFKLKKMCSAEDRIQLADWLWEAISGSLLSGGFRSHLYNLYFLRRTVLHVVPK